MSVEFEEERISPSYSIRANEINSSKKGLLNFLLTKGIVKTEKAGVIVLLSVSILALLITVFVLTRYVFHVGMKQEVRYNIPVDLKGKVQDRIIN